MSAFQSVVNKIYTGGFVGEVQKDGPIRVLPWRLDTQDGVANSLPIRVGYAFTRKGPDMPDGSPSGTQNRDIAIAQPGGTGPFAGILVMPKHYALRGQIGVNALAPTLDLPQYSEGELLTMGFVMVNLTTAYTYGDLVYFVNATGALATGTAGAGQTQIVGAKVISTGAAAGPAIVQFT